MQRAAFRKQRSAGTLFRAVALHRTVVIPVFDLNGKRIRILSQTDAVFARKHEGWLQCRQHHATVCILGILCQQRSHECFLKLLVGNIDIQGVRSLCGNIDNDVALLRNGIRHRNGDERVLGCHGVLIAVIRAVVRPVRSLVQANEVRETE